MKMIISVNSIYQMNKIIMKSFILTLIVLISIPLFSQEKTNFKVFDKDTKDPLSYVNIMVKGKSTGATSDLEGNFNIPSLIESDILVLSHVGYKTLRIDVSKIQDKIIYMKAEMSVLPLVTVSDKQKKKADKYFLNKHKLKKGRVRYEPSEADTTLWIPACTGEPLIEAIYFDYPLEEYKSLLLSDLIITYTNFSDKPAKYRIRIFDKNEHGMPGKDMIREHLIIESVTGQAQFALNMTNEGIIIPENGFFVGFEMLLLPENKFYFDHKKQDILMYSPFLNYLETREEEFVYLYSKGSWTKELQIVPSYHDKAKPKYYKPAISAKLKEISE